MNRISKIFVLGLAIVALAGFGKIGITKAAATPGSLIKMNGLSSVYYLGADSKRYVFPNSTVYFSWYKDFSGVVTISQSELESYPLAANITMRPGTRLVKITTNPKVYAVEPGGTLRAIPDEATAVALYGSNWNKRVSDVADAFFTNYKTGNALAANEVPAGSLVKNAGNAAVYYFDGTNYRSIASEAAFNANRFSFDNVMTISNTITAGGTAITANEFANPDSSATGQGTQPGQGTGLTVALSSNTPMSTTVPKGATNVVFTNFNVTAANDGPVTVTSVKVKRLGVGPVADFDGIFIYDGATRLTNSRSITSDTNTAEFTLNYTIPAGSTKTLSLVGNISASPLGGNHALAIESASSISATGVSVTGSFPVVGNTMSISTSVAASSATIDNVSSSWNLKIGAADAEVAKFSVQAGTNDVRVKTVVLRNGGNLANAYLQNLKLTVGGSQVSTGSMSGDKVTFVLPVPYVITKGQTKNFSVTGNITGGRTSDTIKFYIDETADLYVEDSIYNVGASIVSNFDLGDQVVTMEGGDITMSDNGPSATTYSVNTTNKDLLKIGLTSTRNITVKKTKITIDFGGNFVAGDFTKLKNIRLVDLTSNSTLVGPITDLSSSSWVENNAADDVDTTCNITDVSGCYMVMSDSFDVRANATRNLAIQADFDNTLTSGSTFVATLDFSGTNYMYDNDAAEYVAASKVVPGSITGKTMTVNSSNVDITKSSTPANATFVKGADVNALGISFNTTIADSLKLNKMVARIYADADTTFTVGAVHTGDTAANTIVESASLYDGDTLVKGPVGLTLVGIVGAKGGYYKAEFSNLAYNMAAGSSKKLTVRLKLRNSFTGTKYVAVDVKPSEDVEIENAAGNLLTIATPNLNLAATPNPTITAKQSGNLTVAVDGTTPTADLAATGSNGIEVSKFRFSATNEAFDIVGLKLVNGGSSDANVSKVTLTYTDGAGVTVNKEGYLSNGALTFADGQVGIRVPKDSNAVLSVKVDTNTVSGGAASNGTVKLGLAKTATQFGASANLTNEFIAQGVSSGSKIYGNVDSIALVDTSIAALTIAKTKVTAVKNSNDGSSTVSANNLIGVYRFVSAPEAGSNQNSTLTKATIQLSGSMVNLDGATNAVTVRFYKSSTFDANNLMGSVVVPVTADGITTATEATLSSYNEFNGVQDVYVVVDSTSVSLTPGGTGTKSLSSSLTSFKWNDGVGVITPVSGVPVVGSTNNYSF